MPVCSPKLHAYVERGVQSIRTECLDRFVVLGERPDRVGDVAEQRRVAEVGFVELGGEERARHAPSCNLSATSLMKRASSPSASQSASAAMAPRTSLKGSISDLA